MNQSPTISSYQPRLTSAVSGLGSSTLSVRTEPVQQRSTDRIANLLDAAAELIDEHGIDGLTTSDVATRSGSSVGVVYRYFPNIQSLLRALAARNMDRFKARISGTSEATTLGAAIEILIDSYLAMARSEPGFRALRFGDIIDNRFIQSDEPESTLSQAFYTMAVDQFGLSASEELSFEMDILVEIADALLHRAFLRDRNGEERYVTKLREIALTTLARFESTATA